MIWVKEQLLQDFKDASIVHIYKQKGNQQACNNYRGISLLSIYGKMLARVLLNHLNNHLEHGLLLESQCSFREECWDCWHGACCKTVAREVSGTELWPLLDLCWSDQGIWHSQQWRVWRIMAKYGYPDKFITIVRQFHDGMNARVQDKGEAGTCPGLHSCFLWCCLMHLVAQIMESTFDTALTALSSTSDGFKQRARWRLISSIKFCSPTTVHWMLLPKPTCKTMLTNSQWPMTILV